jgi:hypothetical protein
MISFMHCDVTVISVTNPLASTGSRCDHITAYRVVAATVFHFECKSGG